MKYGLLGLVAVVGMVGVMVAFSNVEEDNPENRVHQHLQSPVVDECDCNGAELCTHLPLVVIDTGGEEIPGAVVGHVSDWDKLQRKKTGKSSENNEKESPVTKYTATADGSEMLSANIKIMDNIEKRHHPGDEPDVESRALIRVRGNSSRRFDKKNYLVRFTDKDGDYKDREVMGMDAHYEWALHGPYLDKTLIRNYMWYNLAGEIMDYAPDVRFCEVIVNGDYKGVYVMTETITNAEEGRLNISEPVKGTTETGYLLRLDRYNDKELVRNIDTFTSYSLRRTGGQIEIKYPKSGSLTPEMARAIELEFSDFEKALYSFDYDTDDYGYWHNIDTGSFIDYWIINEFTANLDAGKYSTYFYKDIGGKYRMAVWDFNSACDNYQESEASPYGFYMTGITWYYMLMKDEDFTERIIQRYEKLRKSWLSDEYLEKYIDDTIAYLGDAVERNFSVWDYTFDVMLLKPEGRNLKSHEAAVWQLKEFMEKRGAWMDNNIEIIRQYSHASKNKKFNH